MFHSEILMFLFFCTQLLIAAVIPPVVGCPAVRGLQYFPGVGDLDKHFVFGITSVDDIWDAHELMDEVLSVVFPA